MLSESERRLARLAVQKRYLTGRQLASCFDHKRASSAPLEKILIDQGILTPDEVDELGRLVQELSPRGPYFAELVKERGLASDSEIREALSVKESLALQNIHRFLGEILVERRVISPDQVAQILEQQGKVSVECGGCGYRFNADHGAGYVCPECARPREAEPAPPAPVPCTIREEMGRGPSGTVYRAFHEIRGYEVALKVLHGPVPAGRDFARSTDLAHPNISEVFEVGVHSGASCVVSRFVEGIPLWDHVLGSIRLPLEEAISILKQTAAALSFAHGRGVVHGNLKAQNVLIGEMREVRLTDFGLAPAGGGSNANDLVFYQAPGRAGAGPTIPGDLYACGVLWYLMLAGEPPFGGPTAEQIRRHHAETQPEPLTRRVAGLPPGWIRFSRNSPARNLRCATAAPPRSSSTWTASTTSARWKNSSSPPPLPLLARESAVPAAADRADPSRLNSLASRIHPG